VSYLANMNLLLLLIARTTAPDVLVRGSVTARIYGGLATGRGHHVDIGVIADICLDPRPNLENHCLAFGAVLQTMAIAIAGLEARCIADAQSLLRPIADQYHLVEEHIDELIGVRVPMALAGPGSRRQPARSGGMSIAIG
jgi:hypothetical protein